MNELFDLVLKEIIEAGLYDSLMDSIIEICKPKKIKFKHYKRRKS